MGKLVILEIAAYLPDSARSIVDSANAIRSATDFTPMPGDATTNIGCSPIKLIGERSPGSSIGMPGAEPLTVTKAEETAISKV